MHKVAIIDKGFDINQIRVQKRQEVVIADNNKRRSMDNHGNLCVNIFLEKVIIPVKVTCYAIGYGKNSCENFIKILNEICEEYDMIFMSIGIKNILYADKFNAIVDRKKKNYIIAAGDNDGKITFPASLKNVLGVSCYMDGNDDNFIVYRKKNPQNGIECLCRVPNGIETKLNSNSFVVPYMAAMLLNDELRYININGKEIRKIFWMDKSFDITVFRIKGRKEYEFAKKVHELLMCRGYIGAFLMEGVDNDCQKSMFNINSMRNIKLEIEYVGYITEADYIIIEADCDKLRDVDYIDMVMENEWKTPEDFVKEITS